MTQKALPFQYSSAKKTAKITGLAGLPLYLELAIKSGLTKNIEKSLQIKQRGWTDVEMILSLIMLNFAGGDCISDINRLEQDSGLRTLLMHFATHNMPRKERRAFERRWRKVKTNALPSNAAFHSYLPNFHSPAEELKRVVGKAFIPAPNENLKSLIELNSSLIESIQQHSISSEATLDQDATLTSTHKRNALYCYKKYKAYQPFNTYWAEHGIVLHSEFRDGNVPAGFEQLRVFKEALDLLPNTVNKVFLRSDSAAYQTELLQYCAEGTNDRFGVIEFAIAAKVSAQFKEEVKLLSTESWQTIFKKDPDGNLTETKQEWAEVCFVPDWVAQGSKQAEYRYIAIRETMTPNKSGKEIVTENLPFPTIKNKEDTYKLFAVITNRNIDGNELIQWHRERCGKSEQVHSHQKSDLCGGQLPSNLFGVNAAWWQIMILSLNLNRLMQLVALPVEFKEKRMKALRFHIIQIPGIVVYHARKVSLKVEEHYHKLYESIRQKISNVTASPVQLGDVLLT